MRKHSTRTIIAGILLFLLSFPWPCSSYGTDAASRKFLRFLTGPVGGQWHTMGPPIATALDNILPVSSRRGGGLTNIKAIDKKNADIAFTLACFLGAGQSGEEEYKDLKTDNVALLASVYPQVLYFLIRKDFAQKNDITSVGTLLSKKIPLRFASLKPGTASEFIITMLLKYGYNTNFEQLKQQGWSIVFDDYAETADEFTKGALDCFAYTAGTNVPLIHAIKDAAESIILPVETQALDILHDKFKTFTYTIQPRDYKNIAEPVPTLGDYTVLIIQKSLPEDMAYQIAKNLWENRGIVSSIIKDFGTLSPKTALPPGIEAHPGAVKFWTTLLQTHGASP